MDATIKVGGSLAENTVMLKTLGNTLCEIAKNHSIVVVPGGAKFADTVREYDQKYHLSANTAHKMAILGMDQYGLLLEQLTPNSCITYSLNKADQISKEGKIPILLPSKVAFREKMLEASWNVTSDSIAACIGWKLKTSKVILVKDVDGIFDRDPREYPTAKLLPTLSPNELLTFTQATIVDKFLPKILMKTRLSCYIVNGAYPERLKAILAGLNTICTLIKA
ncbi:MAG: hypothetical protein QXU99_02415 [Candidatus Bathyarchaeia archaeon]